MPETVTRFQRQVLDSINQGNQTNKAIRDDVNRSEHTVRRTLGELTRMGLVFSQRNGWGPEHDYRLAIDGLKYVNF